MSGSKPEITIVYEGKRLDLTGLLRLPSSNLPKCQVTIRDHPVHFFEGEVIQPSFMPVARGIGYHYRSCAACASVETGKESAVRLVDSAYATAQCFLPNGDVIL